MNERGATALVNIAHNGVPLWENDFTPWFVPIGFALREALHAPVAEKDVAADLDQIIATVSRRRRSGAVAINLAVPYDGERDPGLVLEVDNHGVVSRWAGDTPQLPENIVISTNHLRKLQAPRSCDRHATMVSEINARHGRLTLADMWDIERAVTQDTLLSTTVQTMYFLPATRTMGVSYSAADVLSTFREPAVLSWEDITELPDWVDPNDDEDESDKDTADDEDEAAGCGVAM